MHDLGWELAAELLTGTAWRERLFAALRERLAPLRASVRPFAVAETVRGQLMTLFEMACELLEAARAEHVDAAMEVLTWREATTSDVRRLGVQMALARRIDEQRLGGAGVLYAWCTARLPLRWLAARLHPHVAAGGRLARLLLDPAEEELRRRVRVLSAPLSALRDASTVLRVARVLGRTQAAPRSEAEAERLWAARCRAAIAEARRQRPSLAR